MTTTPVIPHSPDSRRSAITNRLLQEAAEARAAGDALEAGRLLDEVVVVNMTVARGLARRYRGRGIEDEDLEQVAYVALVRAVQQFDPTRGDGFLGYAVPTIRGELRRYFRDNGWMIRPPRRVQELQTRIFAAQSELSMALGRSPSASEMAAHLEVPVDELEEALATEGCFTPTSLDRTVGPDDSELTLGSLLGTPDEATEAVEARTVLAPVVRRLSERDRLILRLRFFDDCTQREIAEAIGVTQTQVSRVLTRILRDLRAGLPDAAPA